MTRISRVRIDSDMAAGPRGRLTLSVVLAAEDLGSGLVPTAADLADVELRLYGGSVMDLDVAAEPVVGADILLVQVEPSDDQACARLANLVSVHGGSRAIVAGVLGLSLNETRKLMRLGIADVLPLPATAEDLRGIVDHGRQIVARANASGPRGKTVTFAKAVGGVGATALLTQLGALLAAGDRSVCLLDLDVQFGSAAIYLDLRPELGLSDLIAAGDRLDGALLRSVAVQHRSKLHVVAAPQDIVPLDQITPEMVGRLVDVTRTEFDMVLLDLPGAWTSWSLAALSRVDEVCFVTEMTVPSIRQVRRQLDVLERENVLVNPPRIVANRVERSWFKTVSFADSERALRHPIDFSVASDFATMSAAIDQGRTLAEIKAGSRVERDIEAIAKALTRQDATTA